MQTYRVQIMKTAMLMAMAATSLHAQLRCDLASAPIVNGQAATQCLEIDSLNGRTVTLPSNVTRLDNQGLVLCNRFLSSTGPLSHGDADFIFIMDQSGSMGLGDFAYAYRTPTGDTLYYQNNIGCTNDSTIGAINITQYGRTPINLFLLYDTAGCRTPSGDPFKIRATAVTQAIDYIASISPTSTVGYLPFADNIFTPALSQRPLPLNVAANLLATGPLKSKIRIDSGGNTNFDAPLDSAKIWMNTLGLGRTSKSAIVLISDGKANPTDKDGFAKCGSNPADDPYCYIRRWPRDASQPKLPIYSIFLGANPTPDTLNLKRLSDTTGGLFFRVPPNHPDSVVGVIKVILRQILRYSSPTRVTLRNTSIVPNQTSNATTPAQFVNQNTTNWQVLLDSAIGLNSATNNLTITAKFQNFTTATDTQNATSTFTLNVSGTASSSKSTAITGPYNLSAQCYAPTSLQWLNSAGSRPPNFSETDAAAPVQMRLVDSNTHLTTARPTLKGVNPHPVTPPGIDSLSGSVRPTLRHNTADLSLFNAAITLEYNRTVVATDTILQTNISDSLIGSWAHPRDPRDFARDIMPIFPTNKVASAYFSANINGSDSLTFDKFDTNVTQAWIFIRDQRASPGKSYSVTVTTMNGGSDQVTLPLTEVSPGFFRAAITLSKALKVANNGILEFAAGGDLMTGTYVDPVYGDQATCQAGIGQRVIFQSYLRFTDSSGADLPSNTNPSLPNATYWSLAKNRVYFKFTDYFLSQDSAAVPVQITARSLKLGQVVGQDNEQASLSSRARLTNDLGTWRGSIPLAELAPNSNGTLEGAYRIEVVATAPAHDTNGVRTGKVDTATLIIAWPDSAAALSFVDTLDAVNPEGPSDAIDTLKSRHFVHYRTDNDTVTATAFCLGSLSADSVHLPFIWNPATKKYVSTILPRNTQSPNTLDSALSCPADSGAMVRFTDPVYGRSYELQMPQVLTPVAIPSDTFFADYLTIALQTGTTGTTDNPVRISYTANGSLPRPGQPTIYSAPFNVTENASIKSIAYGTGYLRSRVATNNYLKRPAVRLGYIKDLDGDGQADAVYLVFQRSVPTLPRLLSGPDSGRIGLDSLYWNEKFPANRRAVDSAHMETLVDMLDNHDTIVMDLGKPPALSPFARFLTGIPSGTANPPVVQFPPGGYFNGLSALLSDSVGPIAHSAVKHPSDLKTYIVGGQTLVNPDTLIITITEPLSTTNYKNLFRFKGGVTCLDVPTSIQNSDTIFTFGDQDAIRLSDTISFKVIVDNKPGRSSPQIGDCVFLAHDGPFTDLNGNRPGLAGVELTGGESVKAIRGIDGYPPVAGLGLNSLANKSDPSVKNMYPSGGLQWIPPVDFPASWNKGDRYTPITDSVKLSNMPYNKTVRPLPSGISTLQLVTSSKYTAHISLSDHTGHFVKSWIQKFGYAKDGEDLKQSLPANGGVRSFLVWDERDSKDQLVGTGVYVWRVKLETRDSTGAAKNDIRVIRTGLVR